MADFYVLPSRHTVGDELANALGTYLPGAPLDPRDAIELYEELVRKNHPEAILVFSEDLPEAIELRTALRDGYGAEATDRIVKVTLGTSTSRPRLRVLFPLTEELPTGT